MIKAEFPICTNQGTSIVSGHKTDADSMIGVHRYESDDPWTVTFLPTGTRIDSLFPQRFQTLAKLSRAIVALESAELIAWLSISDLPFGARDFRPCDAEAVAAIHRAAARQL
jgi:hypothetical protein